MSNLLILFVIYFTTYIFLYVLMLKKRKQMILFIFFVPPTLLSFISLAIIESGAYITEQEKFGYDINALSIYFIYVVSTMVAFFIFSKKIDVGKIPQKKYELYFLLFSAIMILLLLYVNAVNPDASRFNVFAVSPLIEKIGNILNIFYGASFFYFMITEKRLNKLFLYSLTYVFIATLLHVQFSTFLYIFEVFMIAYTFSNKPSQKKKQRLYLSKKKITFSILFIVFIVFMIFYKVHAMGNEIYFVLNRFILQAHMFWGALDYTNNYGSQTVSFSHIIDNFFTWTQKHTINLDIGIGYLMLKLGNPIVVENFYEDNVRWSGGYPSILIFHFGYILAFIINIFAFYIYALYLKYQFYLIQYYNVVIFMLFLKITNPFKDFLLNGEYMRINFKFFIYMIVFYIFVELLKNINIKSSKNLIKPSVEVQ